MLTRNTVSCDRIIGTQVYNYADENLGKIEDVMVNVQDGAVAYLVLSHGGILGTTMADKRFAIPFDAIKVTEDGNGTVFYRLDIAKARLEAAPGFNKDEYPDFADTRFTTQLNRYYGYSANGVS